MSNHTRVSKMFGALVLGGSLLVHSSPTEADPPKPSSPSPTPTKSMNPEKDPPSTRGLKAPLAQLKNQQTALPPPSDQRIQRPKNDCQLEFTHYKYKRDDKIESVSTCLDEKNDEEILKIIKEAKKQTCRSPFCGCWLG